MISGMELERLNRAATRRAAHAGKVPIPFEECDRAHVSAADGEWFMPFIGDRVPRGYKRTDRDPAFCDHSGFGSESEPAMTLRRLAEWLRSGYYYGVIESGQFQSYVGEFERGGTKVPKVW